MDPLVDLFGKPAMNLFDNSTFEVAHGPVERFPEWMRRDALASIDSLCAAYRGRLEIAHGGVEGRDSRADAVDSFIGVGGQIPVGIAPAHALLRLGLTVYFVNLREAIPATAGFLRDLEQSLGLPPCSTLGAFANAPGSGLPIHHDSHDQLLFQLIGEKEFTFCLKRAAVHPGISVSPLAPEPLHFATVYRDGVSKPGEAAAGEGMQRVRLSPGSCVFMPAGTWHRTSEQSENCLSLAVAIRAPSQLDLIINAIRYYAGQSSEFRAPAYGLATGNRGCVATLATQLAQQIENLDDDMARQCWLSSQLRDGQTEAYPSQEQFLNFIRLPGTHVVFEAKDDDNVRCRIRCMNATRDNVLEFRHPAQRIVEELLKTSGVFDVHSFARRFSDFEEDEVISFLGQLAQVGLLRPVPVPAWPATRDSDGL